MSRLLFLCALVAIHNVGCNPERTNQLSRCNKMLPDNAIGIGSIAILESYLGNSCSIGILNLTDTVAVLAGWTLQGRGKGNGFIVSLDSTAILLPDSAWLVEVPLTQFNTQIRRVFLIDHSGNIQNCFRAPR